MRARCRIGEVLWMGGKPSNLCRSSMSQGLVRKLALDVCRPHLCSLSRAASPTSCLKAEQFLGKGGLIKNPSQAVDADGGKKKLGAFNMCAPYYIKPYRLQSHHIILLVFGSILYWCHSEMAGYGDAIDPLFKPRNYCKRIGEPMSIRNKNVKPFFKSFNRRWSVWFER